MSTIQWELPPRRRGMTGMLDAFVGPGATKAELLLQFGGATVAAVAASLYAAAVQPEWGFVHRLLTAVFAVDLIGGIITNATSAAKRWYHRPQRGHWAHLSFAAVHLLHVVLVAWLFMGGRWDFLLQAAGILVTSILLVHFVPLYLQRPVAFICYSATLLFFLYGPEPVTGLEWFVPFFFLKVLMSHAVREEPYRPERGAAVTHELD